MKVIHIVKSIDKSFGGEGLAALKLSQYTDSLLIVASDYSESPKWETPEDFGSKIFFGSSFMGIISLIINRKKSLDLVHIHGVWHFSFFIYVLLSKLLGIRCLISTHGCFGEWAISSKWFKKKVALFLYQRLSISLSDGLVANSSLELKDLKKRFPNKRVFEIRNGVDIPQNCVRTERYTKCDAHAQPANLTFLFLSRLSPVKGVELLLKAWRAAYPERSNHTLLIAGNGDPDYVQSLKDLSNSLDLSANVKFLGSVTGSAKDSLFLKSDIFVLPSYGENFGIVVAEAMLNSLPVITTKKTPWGALCSGSMGWYVDCEVESLADALVNAGSASFLELSSMGQKCHNHILDNFSWEHAAMEAKLVYEVVTSE